MRACEAAVRAALLGGALVVLVAGCGVVPGAPAPVPTSVVPPLASPSMAAARSGDGFDDEQRIALRLRAVSCDGLATGSGFAVDAHTLVTARHVVDDATSVQLSTYDGHDALATSVRVAAAADLAVVRTRDALPAASALAADDPEVGDDVTVVGYPLGRALDVTTGHVTAVLDDPLDENTGVVMIADATVEPGSSGSPVLDDEGHVAGVVYAKGRYGSTYFVPVSTLRSMLDDDDAFVPAPGCS
ncbi:S1 family peptidase [Cellulomonas edaphi]|uniref:Trypsin-like peptidase domain-containing protein n=1 Tax=Cellulomonas edaphi TaxID=3053468 RepID=A0ABT7S8N6_9CELL|nr:trypsin-like peptidase domain-containing protein [Cellulomons edaphi]MDM7831987.1 trypsin-like peptidase domain-containing protein [Cellulomons edaphi]